MATSGSNYYSPDGGTLRLILSWSRIQTDIANNRSKIRLTLQLRHSGTGVWFSARKSGRLHGQSFTYSGGFSNTGTVTLRTRELWVNHNADGTKTQTFNASFNIAITYRGSHLGNMSTSVTANIDRIPRASSVNSFSIANHLEPSTSNSINLSISRASSSFTHDIELRDGSTVLRSWRGQGTPTSLNLTSTEIDTLLNRMSNVTSRTLTLRVVTKSGSSTIGTTSRNAAATVDSSVKPSVSDLTLSPSDFNEFDGNYVQTHNKLTGSYTSSVRGGATIRSQSITVSKDDDVLVISGTSGTTPRAFKYGGTYDVIAETVDSRGRSSTLSETISVMDYWNPRIEKFEVKRQTDTPTIVDFQVETDVAYYARGDYWDTTIERQLVGTSLWEEVYSFREIWNSQSGTIDENNVSNSYIFRLTVDDGRGGVTTATTSIATQRVVLDIHKNEGVGIGKIHERGVLDVDGSAYFDGSLFVSGEAQFDGDIEFLNGVVSRLNSTGFTGSTNISDYPRGFTYFDSAFSSGFPNNTGTVINFKASGTRNLQLFSTHTGNELMYRQFHFEGENSGWANWRNLTSHTSGSNSNGEWIRFSDGTQICTAVRATSVATGANSTHNGFFQSDWFSFSYPAEFIDKPAFSVTPQRLIQDDSWALMVTRTRSSLGTHTPEMSYLRVFQTTGSAYGIRYIAIGRWK